jgi:RNA polymerase sigma factor for flagellar operon FliA
MVASVRTALAQLEKRDVMILCLHYIEEQTYQEIGGLLNITPSRVCQLLWRAVKRVRAQLGLVIEDGSLVAA